MSISRPDDVYHFPNDLPIELCYKNTQTYSKCTSYDPKVMAQGFVWHQIIVQHNGKISGRDGVQEVLEALFHVVEGEELFPIAYRHGAKEDRFLVRKCKAAINKLFDQNLRIQLSDASFVQLQVKFNVGAFRHGQISPYAKLTDALNRLYTCMERVNGINGILNMARFNDQPEFFDLIVNLGNRAVFEGVCKLIYRNDEKFRSVNGLILSDNSITTVAPLTVFSGVDFSILDLRNNKIPDPGQEFTKEEIFDYFFITVSPTLADIYPCYYKFTADEHQFLVRQCFDQLKYLVDVCNMEIKIPRLSTGLENNVSHSHVQIDKVLKYYMLMNISPYKLGQVDPLDSIDKALNRRYNAINRLLNLDHFQNIEGLENIVINLGSLRILNRVLLQASKTCLASCVELRLAHNKITHANGLNALSAMSNLKAIDLGNNWILDLADVRGLSVLGLKTLRLDGNPLCAKFSFAGEYIKAVRKYFPELTKLDNTDIKREGGINSQKNFLCDVKGYDFIDEFVPRYFKAFDSNERQNLRDSYHGNAIFTMSFNYHIAQMTSQNIKRISKYRESRRNILQMSDLSRAHTTIHMGSDQIMQIFLQLPSMRHDILTFNTDTVIYNENMVVTTINGVFYDQAPSIMDNDILMAFTRTFVMIPVEKYLGILNRATKYQIVNEQLSIYNPTVLQTKNAFKYFKTESQGNDHEMTVADKEALIVMFQEVTNMKSVWCSRFLEDARWDFRKSLLLFLGSCDRKEIPDTAFN
ncbi:nuclear RNA export factor 2 isoform X2 [Eurosta solidaginis]|uniref:nuclear RNA export factor 2 isoform X2 n=1 Tax=Eurosta solidaginis TaxID=178769 RepID=UPI003530B5EB